MRQLSFAVLTAAAVLAGVGTAQAGLLGGGCGGHHHHGGCGSSCGSSGGCASGHCGAPMGGCASGYCGAPMGGCASGYCYTGGTVGGCPGGVCVAAVESPRTATLVVSLPADARLLIDGQATTSETARRVFETPALNTGREYYYTLQAQVVRDGKTEVITQRVAVRPGESTEVRLEVPATSVAAR